MILKQFMVGCGKTINLGNFQSLKIEAQVFIEVREGENNLDGLKIEAQEELKHLLEQTYKAQRKLND
jgi:hypothetical protein